MNDIDDNVFRIQRGEIPAPTIRQLVDAQRQNLFGAGADLSTIEYIIDRAHSEGSDTVEFEAGDWVTLQDTVSRLREHIEEIDCKATLAFDAALKDPPPESLHDEFMAWLEDRDIDPDWLTQQAQAELAVKWATETKKDFP